MLDSARRRFDWFFFESCDPRLAPAFRIAYAVLVVIYVMTLIPDAARWFSDEGVLSVATAREMTGTWHETPFYYITSPAAIQIALGIFLLQSVLLLFGCWSRFQAACIFLWLVSFQHRNLMITDGEDVVFRWFALLMMFMPLDDRWSLASQLSRRKATATPQAMWPLRLIQLQFAVIYFSSAWCKLQGETWRDGSALYYIAHQADYFGRIPAIAPFFSEPWCYRTLTWGTIAIEALVPILIWFPRLRIVCLLTAAALHIGIELTMNLYLFQWIMLVGLIAFIPLQPPANKSP